MRFVHLQEMSCKETAVAFSIQAELSHYDRTRSLSAEFSAIESNRSSCCILTNLGFETGSQHPFGF